jgi:glycosyltransferase involved in cell wall biosynthesis
MNDATPSQAPTARRTGRGKAAARATPPAEPIRAEPTLAEPTLVEPTLAEPTLAEPTLAEPTLAEPALAEAAAPEAVPPVASPAILTTRPLRVLVASHSHPELSKGGAEIAAYQLYHGYTERSECQAWFLGCDRRRTRAEVAISQPFAEREFLYSVGEFDWFKFSNRDPRFPEAFGDLLADLKPDIVHFHHYINFGVEAFALVKRVLPQARTVVTLHEYLAICNHHGQMVTNPSRNLCYQASPTRCIECFPDYHEADFFLRRRYIEHFFDFVDHFTSPSQFLADRYIRWGLAPDRISVIENLVRPLGNGGVIRPVETSGPLRTGFFGQLSFLKGANVLLDAAALLDKEERTDISFEIFGDYRSQPPEFQKELLERLSKASQNVRMNGPYDETRVDMLMQSVDLTIIPSTWWENSPLVIQEARRNGRPVICSDIGGMAEKVRDGVDGYHFHAGNALSLASLLKRIADNREMLSNITRTIRKIYTMDEIIDANLALYRRL